MINDEILNIAKEAYLKISDDEANVALKHQFSLETRQIWVLYYFCWADYF